MSSKADNTEDSQLSLTGMATQLGINVGIAVGVLLVFNILRPNNSLVYAPKYKYATKTKQPPELGHGFFAWFRPVMHTPDSVLIEKIGFDATLFIQFIRMIRRMLYFMTFIGVCVIIPINIVATSFTGEWPPNLGLEFLSISTINYYDGKFHASNGDLNWYWCHAAGTWIYSLIIYFFLWRFYSNYVVFRQQYFESDDYQMSMHGRSLMIFNVPQSMRSDQALTNWVNSLGLKYPAQQVCIGTQNTELAKYVEEHEDAVRKLEIILSNHLKDGHVIEGKKRPLVRIGGYLGCCGGVKVDAINYYSEKIQELQEKITDARSRISTSKKTNYGWISYDKVSWAHANAKHLASSSSPLLSLPKRISEGPTPSIELAPQPKDIIWSNLALNEHVKRTKRLIVTFIFYGFVFFWFIPSSFLSASSNVKDFLRLFPGSTQFMKQHKTFVSLLSSWFTPIVMAIFFFILPKVLRFMSQQQGYMTGTSLDRQVLAKLFIFFIINNLLVFTVSSTLIAVYAEIQKAVVSGTTLTAKQFFSTMSGNLTQVAKNLSDVSTYWVNYVSLKGLGVIVDLAQVVVLLTVTLRKLFTRPSPRQLQEFTRPTAFDYPLFYNVLLFFFTVGLIYSVIAPLVLPFTMIYFLLATMVFKYLLMYVFVTGVETGGQIWRLLFNRLLVSTVLFQVIMIAVLNLKSARIPSIAVAPLPLVTILFKIVCSRRFDGRVYYYTPKTEQHSSTKYDPDHKFGSNGTTKKAKNSIGFRFGDPAFFAELPVPMVHERVRHLLPKLYGSANTTSKKPFISRMTRQKSVRHVSVIHLQNNSGGGGELQFQSIGEKDLELDDSTEGVKGMYKFNEDEESQNVVDPPKTSYYSNSFSSHNNINNNTIAMNPLKRLSNRITSSLHYNNPSSSSSSSSNNDIYSARRPLVTSISYLDTNSGADYDDHDIVSSYRQPNQRLEPTPPQRQMTEDMEYFVAGRAYRSHDPHSINNTNVIEMANIYRAQQQPYEPHPQHNPLVDNYNQYIRNPINAYTTGNGKTKNHQHEMSNSQYHKKHEYL